MNASKTINIIGGGIAGLSTALALQSTGINFNLYEANPEITYENVGFGISANMFHILKEWKILNETRELGTEIKHFHFVDKGLKYIKSFSMDKPALSVNRKLFYELLYGRLKKQYIHLNSPKAVSDFSPGDIVIAADGINSKIRKNIYPNLKLRDSDQVLWRGISKISLDKNFQNAYHDFVGNNLRFAIIHTGRNFYSWYIVQQKSQCTIVSLDQEQLMSVFKDYHPIVGQVIAASRNIYCSGLLDIDPQERKNCAWHRGNTLLIGDAIHPTTPNMANGACLSMEDAYLLAYLLGRNNASVTEAFETFEKMRIKKVNNVVNQSYFLGKLMHQKYKFMDHLIIKGMALTPQFIFNKIYSGILQEIKINN